MITLHPEEKTPLYEQLYAALAADIRSGDTVTRLSFSFMTAAEVLSSILYPSTAEKRIARRILR